MREQGSSSRRAFLGQAAATVAMLHAPLLRPRLAPGSLQPMPSSNLSTRFARLRLRTHLLKEMRAFYGERLGLPVLRETADSFTLEAGGTELEFARTAGTEPVYHFAFSVPENRFAEAKAWLKARTPLVTREGGSDEYHFAHWDAHAAYFRDPAGNIGEFIAHHSRGNASNAAFGPGSIEHVVEIGLVVPDVAAAAGFLHDNAGVKPFGGKEVAAGAEFAAIGDTDGMFIVVKDGRPWFGAEELKAAAFPVDAEVRGAGPKTAEIPGRPYTIRIIE
jgi:catechol 2,3-dioxygenase-like lactoylglutathione lyase family enzyme